MKEIICDRTLGKKEKQILRRLRREIKQILPRFYTIDGGAFGIFYISKFLPYGGLVGKRAKIYYQSKSTIQVGDKKLYPILKQFGEKNGYARLVKCWKGCEQGS